MSGREEILGRIREALSVKSDAGVKGTAGDGIRDVRAARGFLPPGGETPAERLQRFQELAGKLKAEVVRVPDAASAAAGIRELAASEGWSRVAAHHHPLVEEVLAGQEPVWTEDAPGIAVLEAVDAGVTACEALIAQTGSVLVTSKGCGGRALSVLPPHHVVVATMDQLMPDMLAGFDHLRARYGETMPSFISFITGASRTGDIERILVLGAHGPKKLTIFIVGALSEG